MASSASDNFNRSGNLDGSTASGGGTWTEQEGTGWTTNGTQAVNSNSTSHQDHWATLDVQMDSVDHYAEVDLVDITPGSSSYTNAGVIIRALDTTTKTFYCCYGRGTDGNYQVMRFNAGSSTTLVTAGTFTDGDTLRLTATTNGSQVELRVEVNGSPVGALDYDDTDANRLTTGDYGGVFYETGSGSGDSATLDNFAMAVVGGVAATPKGPFGHPFHGPFAGPIGPAFQPVRAPAFVAASRPALVGWSGPMLGGMRAVECSI